MMILSEFQEGTKNARVYKMENGTFGLECYDSETDGTKFYTFVTEEEAEIAGEDWVVGNVPF